MIEKNVPEVIIPMEKQMQYGLTSSLRKLSEQNSKLKKIISEFEKDQAREEISE